MSEDAKKIHVGGQAVIEGVMMRSSEYVATAVRKPDGRIALKRELYVSWTKRFKILGLPFFRGGVVLIESLVLGIKALNFSGEVAMTEEEKKKEKPKKSGKEGQGDTLSKLVLGGTIFLALGLGFGIFFFLPLLITEWIGVEGSLMFNLVDGLIRLAFFIIYLVLISLWKEIRRVFEYHGAEHMSIFAYEGGKPLTVEGVRAFTTHHPRCGTSFLMVVMIVAFMVFIVLGKPDAVGDRLIRFLFVPVIGGISYEVIRLSNSRYGRFFSRILVAPGMWLQRVTTKEPDDSQLEVALVALKSSLDMDVGDGVDMTPVKA